MFCPKCATQNNEGARFCRSCGADISLIPQAMTGEILTSLPVEMDDDRESRRSRRRGKRASIDSGIKNAFMGLGFIVVAVALSTTRSGAHWWYWMLIPGFMMLGGGLAEYLKWRHERTTLPAAASSPQLSPPVARRASQLPPRNTSELVAPPPSVTEGTTRHLGAEAPTKVFSPVERPKE